MRRSPLVLLAVTANIAGAASSVSWTIDETLTRAETELHWTSPSAIEVGLDEYAYAYEITRIEATTLLFGAPFTIDVAPLLGADTELVGGGVSLTLPTVLIDEELSDATTGTSARVFIEVDAFGFGQAAFTNVVLGAVNVPVLGRREIESVRIEGFVSLEGLGEGEPSDFTGDGAVDRSDYARWVAEFGRRGTEVTADANGDARVDAADYTVWRDRFESPLDSLAVPGPTSLGIALPALVAAITGRARRQA